MLKPEVEPFPVSKMRNKEQLPPLGGRFPEATRFRIEFGAQRQRVRGPPAAHDIKQKTAVGGQGSTRQSAPRAGRQVVVTERKVTIGGSRKPKRKNIRGQTDRSAHPVEERRWKRT